MTLPTSLQTAIDNELSGLKGLDLSTAVEGLSSRYRDPNRASRQFMAAEIDRMAYIACRMPATYAVVCRVLDEMQQMGPEILPQSILDLGSGPGTANWAASETLRTLEAYNAIEADANLIAIGKRLSAHSESLPLQQTNWKQQDLTSLSAFPKVDLVIASYALGELQDEPQMKVLAQAWQSADKALILIEPGTPVGFQRILAWRKWLIDTGAYLVAPCPHSGICPMAGNDWCHFSQRLSRTSQHRQLKGASLGHEDEKFSYLIATKQPVVRTAGARLLRHPQKHSGHVELMLCSENGAGKRTISRRDGDLYKKARKAEWGDIF